MAALMLPNHLSDRCFVAISGKALDFQLTHKKECLQPLSSGLFGALNIVVTTIYCTKCKEQFVVIIQN